MDTEHRMPHPNPWLPLLLASLLATTLALPARAQDTAAMSAVNKARPPVQQPTLKSQNSPAVRSAQNDCVREANRRGFAVLDTGQFKQFGDGWFLEMQVRDMRGRVSRGSCFVETGSGEVSLYGFGWGYDDAGDDRMEFSCASMQKKYEECQLPIDGRVRLVKRRSDAPCVEGQTWGQRGDRVWVDRGCRARFEVQRVGPGGGAGGQTIDCRSEDGRYRECQIGPGYFGRLAREYSKGRCREDVTWGTRNGVIWVTDGCKAQFVRQRGNAGGGNGGGGNRYVECQSADGRYRECLDQDYSGRCRKDSTWGTRDGVVWVTAGCSGRFERVRAQQ
jgi:hypothetical protein